MLKLSRRQMLASAASLALDAGLPTLAQAKDSGTTLVAAYFGGWCQPMEKSQKWIHGENPWGVYPNARMPGVKNHMGSYPERFPLIGPAPEGYDDAQPWVIESEIKTASGFGIDVFAMNWFRDEFLNRPMLNFKACENTMGMKFFLQWSNNSNASVAPPADTREYFFEGIRRAAIHMRATSYWRQDGLPVFAIFDVTQIDRIINLCRGRAPATPFANRAESVQLHDAFLQECHRIASHVLAGDDSGGISGKLNQAKVADVPGQAGFRPAMYLMVSTSDVSSWAPCPTVQGMYCYNIRTGDFDGKNRLTHSFAEMMTACQQNYDAVYPEISKRGPGKAYWATIMAGFDQRPWGGTTSDPRHDNCVPTAAEFDSHCKQVRAVLDRYPEQSKRVAFIYAWNEMGEGGWIIPTPSIGTTRLAALQRNFKR